MAYTAKQAEKDAKSLGFKEISQKGSHKKMRHADGRTVIIPVHTGDLSLGVEHTVKKSLGLK